MTVEYGGVIGVGEGQGFKGRRGGRRCGPNSAEGGQPTLEFLFFQSGTFIFDKKFKALSLSLNPNSLTFPILKFQFQNMKIGIMRLNGSIIIRR